MDKRIVVVLYILIGHTSVSKAPELRAGQNFRHYIRQLVGCADVCKVHDIFIAPVADDMMLDIDVLGAFRGHIVCDHAYCRLIVFAEENRFMKLHA